ncbi:MAG TPA: DUF5060 domain-containing protein, partial [Pricia sp.]|nr:DUF5060 domain-containing protein [Pricia sp.]
MHLQIPREPYLLMCTLIFVFSACNKREKIQNYVLDGSFEKWHPITLTFDGPQISETDADNPFLNYALQVDFQNGKDLYTVHGFYAADGDAAETSAN